MSYYSPYTNIIVLYLYSCFEAEHQLPLPRIFINCHIILVGIFFKSGELRGILKNLYFYKLLKIRIYYKLKSDISSNKNALL